MDNSEASVTAQLRVFSAVARKYCRWLIDEGQPRTPSEALRVLTGLYASALSLSDLDLPDLAALPEGCAVMSAELSEALARAARFPFQQYGVVLQPHVLPPENPATGNLADDLSDIYSDLKSGLNAWDMGEYLQAGAFWQFTFVAHWGGHLTSALRALHRYRFVGTSKSRGSSGGASEGDRSAGPIRGSSV